MLFYSKSTHTTRCHFSYSPLSSIVNVSQSQRDLDKFIIGNAECGFLKVLQEKLKSADVSDILLRDLVAMMPKDIKTSSKIRNSNTVLHGVV